MRYVALSLMMAVATNDAFRILGLFPLPIKSHFIMFENVLKALARNGHEVDVLSHFSQENPIHLYNDISISDSMPSMSDNVTMEEVQNFGMWSFAIYIYGKRGTDVCENVLQHPATIKLKTSKVKYDVIITEVFGTDCLLGFAHLFQVPVIGITSGTHLPWGNDRMGNPDNPSYIPNYFMASSGKMILSERIQIALASIFSKVGYYIFSTIPSEMRARDFFGSDMPHLDDLAFNMSLLLVNTHFSINHPRPTVPAVVEVGGLHIKEIKPLPQALQQIANSSEDGIIYFSMGTVLRMDSFDPDKIKVLLDVFSKLPHKILWKGEKKSIPVPIPANVYFQKWMPQLDVLCHPKTRLFITHGGHMGIQEAVNCGVPILGIPAFADQDLNICNYVENGAGLRLTYSELNKEKLTESLNQLLYNNSYSANAQELSRKFKDRPMNALDTALYWVEYVVRHGGAPHLRTRGADLIWFEYYLVDVAIVFIVLFVMFLYVFAFIMNGVQNYFDRPRDQPKRKQE